MVAKRRLKITWTQKAIQSLESYYFYIKSESPKSANAFRKEILKTTKDLGAHPRKFQRDEYYPKNQGEIRRFFKWNYRIVYEVNQDSIDILNVIHTSRKPSTS